MTQKPVFVEGIFTLRNLRSMGAAAIVEILIALSIAGILIWHQLHVVVQPPSIADPITPIETVPLPPKLQHTDTTPQAPTTQPFQEVPSVPTDIPGPTTQPLQPLQPPFLPQRTQPPADVVNEFGARMLQAINAQKVYPKAAMLKAETGEAVVSFDYVDGVVSNIHVDRSSGSYELDAAAVAAVQKAVLPEKPSELAGLKHFVFQLDFSLGG